MIRRALLLFYSATFCVYARYVAAYSSLFRRLFATPDDKRSVQAATCALRQRAAEDMLAAVYLSAALCGAPIMPPPLMLILRYAFSLIFRLMPRPAMDVAITLAGMPPRYAPRATPRLRCYGAYYDDATRRHAFFIAAAFAFSLRYKMKPCSSFSLAYAAIISPRFCFDAVALHADAAFFSGLRYHAVCYHVLIFFSATRYLSYHAADDAATMPATPRLPRYAVI